MRYKQTMVKGITGIGVPSLTKETMDVSKGQGTFYGGLLVTEDIKNQIMSQEIGSFLHVEPKEEGEYLLQYKLPEKGLKEDGREYSIRKNINRLYKAICKKFVSEDGTINLQEGREECIAVAECLERLHGERKRGDLNGIEQAKQPLRDLVGYEEMTEEEKADFDTFLDMPNLGKNCAFIITSGIIDRLNLVQNIQRVLGEQKLNKDEKEVIANSIEDYKETIQSFRNMANMDIETAQTYYIPADCATSKDIIYNTYDDVMRYRFGNLEYQKSADFREIRFSDGKMGHFDKHHFVGFPVTIDGSTKYMTLETTGTPYGKLLFHPEKGYAALGIYENVEEVERLYKADNNIRMDDPKICDRIHNRPVDQNNNILLRTEAEELKLFQTSKRKFHDNSYEYDEVKDSLQAIKDINTIIKNRPYREKTLQNALLEEYKNLEAATREYLDHRNPWTEKGKERYAMVQRAYQLSRTKIMELTPKVNTTAIPGFRNALTGYLTPLKEYTDLVKELNTVQKNGLRKPMTTSDVTALKECHTQVLGMCERLLGDTTLKLKKEERKRLIELNDQILKEVGALQELKRNPSGEWPTYHDGLRIGDRMIVDISGEKVGSVGGAMSHRMPLDVIDENGVHRKGFFTQNMRRGDAAQWAEALKSETKDKPELKPIVDALSRFSFDEIYEKMSEVVFERPDKPMADFEDIENYFDFISEPDQNKRRDSWIKLFDKLNLEPTLLGHIDIDQMQSIYGAFAHCYETEKTYKKFGLEKGASIAKRNNAMSDVAVMMGKPELLAKTTDMSVFDGEKVIPGVFMDYAKGFALQDIYPENPVIGNREIVFDTAEAKKSIADLQVLDYICGNVDRHGKNFHYILEEDGERLKVVGVQGIDNDFSFLSEDVAKNPKNMTTLDELGVISKSTALKILGMQEESFKMTLERQGIRTENIQHAWDRVAALKDQIVKGYEYFKDRPKDERIPVNGKLLILEDNEWEKLDIKTLTDILKEKRFLSDTLFQSLKTDIKIYENRLRKFQRQIQKQGKKEAIQNAHDEWKETHNLSFTEVSEAQEEKLKLIDQNNRFADLLEQFLKTETKEHKNTKEYDAMVNSLGNMQQMFYNMIKELTEGNLRENDYNKLRQLQREAIKGVNNYIQKKGSNPRSDFGKQRLSLAKNMRGCLGFDIDEIREDLDEKFMKEQNARLKEIQGKEKNLKTQINLLENIKNYYPDDHEMHTLGVLASSKMEQMGAAIIGMNADPSEYLEQMAWIISYEKIHDINLKTQDKEPKEAGHYLKKIEDSVQQMMTSNKFKELYSNITKDQMYEFISNPKMRNEIFEEMLHENIIENDGNNIIRNEPIDEIGEINREVNIINMV